MSKDILFFIAGPVPTPAEKEAAASLGTRKFRNVKLIVPKACLEKCSGVAGLAPNAYIAKFGRVEVPEKSKIPTDPPKVQTPPPPPPPSATTPPTTPPGPWAPPKAG
jgi:hypothetical protein